MRRFVMRLLRWTPEGTPPAIPKYVVIIAPHTSNWDFFWLLAMRWYFRLPIGFLAKHTLFRGPFGWIMRALGGVPVDRAHPGDLLDRVTAEFRAHDRFAIGLAPEGTRHRAEHWKSGFLRMARAAGVPVVLGYLDYPRRRGGFGPVLEPSDDPKADMDVIRAFYADKGGKFPALVGPIRLEDERPG